MRGLDDLRARARELRAEASRLNREADGIEKVLDAAARAEFDRTPLEPPTELEILAARGRLRPYLHGYPIPMIDTRRLRIENRTATLEERRAVAAEDVVWLEHRREAAGLIRADDDD